MQIQENKKVSFDYTLKNDEGQVLDSSEEREPLSYIQGNGELIPGLENALEGKTKGEDFSVSIEPDQAYGEYDDNLIFDVPKDRFQNQDNISEGMQVQAQLQDGSTQVLTIKEVGDENVTLDANHPLAGRTLHFDIHVKDVQDASQEELDHGQSQE